ncbi:MAG TPA: hypothetical protein PLL30_10820 [Candidatus Krumholzibacteria bacterium]|nr:hypothetical protein [Candidatus Krumholzibacteria bacterium]HPD72256.1 hypothetical protein [Candidatus Krumholzibacteria bacterium]HRY40812.1 hypothetical protein [Candidatus Krumholzibacteria bacterium]
MRDRRHLLAPASLALASLLVAGCSSDDATPIGAREIGVDDYDAIDFDQPFGGLTITDEAPAFGDDYLIQLDAQADLERYTDELADDPEVREMHRRGEAAGDPDDPTRPRFTFLRVVWGALDGAIDEIDGRPEDGDLVDWSGRLSVDRGIVLVRRVILFERPLDAIVGPRVDRQSIAWRSHTGRHYDGLVIEIIEPPHVGDDPPRPNVLHFETGPFTRDIAIDELSGLDEVFAVEPAGNAIHFAGFTLGDIGYCPKGFLAGHWRDAPDGDRTSGQFRGRWVDLYGLVRGYLLGAYGLNDDGERVLFGKFVGRDGRFEGIIAGTWSPDEREGHGTFEAQWTGESGQVEGVLGGRYVNEPDRPDGFFHGRWSALCDEEAVGEIQ